MAISCFVPNASSVSKALIPTAAYSASDATSYFPVDRWSSAGITAVVATCSGTLNIYVQKLLPDTAGTYMDIGAFPTFNTAVFTTTGTYNMALVNAGNSITQQNDAALTANSTIVTNFGLNWRIKFVLGGVGATATFAVYGAFTE